MHTFDLLCALVTTGLGLRPVDPPLVAALAAAERVWPRLITLSGVHLLTPALAPALQREGLDAIVPAELGGYLAAMHEAAAQRNAALRAELERVAVEINGVGVVPVALKGAIRLVDGLWPDPASRFMHDLDLLVPEPALAACAAQLQVQGWLPAPAESAEALHHLALYHPEGTARVELHRQPLAAPHDRLLPASAMLARARPEPVGTAVIALPALEDQLVHLVAHGMLQHGFLENGRFLLRDCVEQSLLSARAGRGELAAAGQRFAAAGQRLAWEVSRELTARCLGGVAGDSTRTARLLAARMLLQQRSTLAMQIVAPAGWLAARLLGVRSATPAPTTLSEFTARFALFRRKTLW